MNGEDTIVLSAPRDVLDVIYESAEMLVVNKPPGIPMGGDEAIYGRTIESLAYDYMRARGIFDETHEQLQQARKRKKQLKFVHQLDFGTSGVLCLAFTKDMAARLAHCFEMRTVRKYYIALLHGHVPCETAPPEAGASCDQSGSTCAPDTVARQSPFVVWVNGCNKAWEGLGCVRVVCSSSREGAPANSADSEELERLRHLLQQPLEPALEAAALLNVKGAAKDRPATVVHRYRSSRSTVPSLTTTTLEDLAPVPADAVEDLIYRTLSENAASHSVINVDLPVGYDSTDPEHLRMAVMAEHSRGAKTSLLVLKRTYLAAPPPAESEAQSCDTLTQGFASATRYPVTLVLLAPHTGRRHQLRVHCRAIGFPIVGDTLYCTDLPWCAALPLGPSASTWTTVEARRMYLHAWRLLLPGTAARHLDETERVALKKKRRRETLGLSEQGNASVSASRDEWTEFIASVSFSGLDLEEAEERGM
nr:hypothetical protein, conserved [Leishmania guyanensis]